MRAVAPVVEVANLPEKKFLITSNMLTEDVISLTGGQLFQLVFALYVYENATNATVMCWTLSGMISVLVRKY